MIVLIAAKSQTCHLSASFSQVVGTIKYPSGCQELEEIGRCCLRQETPRKGLENSMRKAQGLPLCSEKPAGLLELPKPT